MQIESTATPSLPAKPPRDPSRAGGAVFSDLLAQIHAGELSAVAAQMSAQAGLLGTSSPESTSPRRARIDQQTNDARQAEIDRYQTRRADPSSVRNGTVSARHERIVALQKESGGAIVAPNSDPGGSDPIEAPTVSPSRISIDLPSRENALAKVHADLQPITDADHGNAQYNQPGKADAIQPTVPATSSAPKPTAPTSVVTAPAPANGQPVQASPAQVVGRILAASNNLQGSTSPGDSAQSATIVTPGRGSSAESKLSADSTQCGDAPNGKQTTGRTGTLEFANLIRGLRLNTGPRISTATIRLDPPELGQLRIQVRMVDDELVVRVEASTSKGKEMIESRAAELTAALKGHDIRVERFEVVSMTPPADGTNPEQVVALQEQKQPPQENTERRNREHRRRDGSGMELNPPTASGLTTRADEGAGEVSLDMKA